MRKTKSTTWGKRSPYRFPLEIKVGKVSVRGATVNQCRALTKCAKTLSEATPLTITADAMSISAGAAHSLHAVNAAKQLAEATPPSVKIPGVSVKSGSLMKLVLGLTAVCFVVYGGKLAFIWASKKFFPKPKSTQPDSMPISQTSKPVAAEVSNLNQVIAKTEAPTDEYVKGFIPVGGNVIVFGPTGSCKSILVDGAGIDLAEGNVPSFAPHGGTVEKPLEVVLFDAELSDANIKKRYGKHKHVFPENFRRVRNCVYASAEDFLKEVHKQAMKLTDDGIIILDNITAACPSIGQNATREFYDRLNEIKAEAKFTITFMVVCHTTKAFKEGAPIELNHLAGSANVSNFATNVIAIGPTQFTGMKMLKVLKDRDNPCPEHIFLQDIVDEPYVHLTYNNTISEEQAMPVKKKASKGEEVPLGRSGKPLSEDQNTKMKLLLSQGMGPDEVARQIGCSRDTVQKRKKAWIEAGELPKD